jgi:hypothetical protein
MAGNGVYVLALEDSGMVRRSRNIKIMLSVALGDIVQCRLVGKVCCLRDSCKFIPTCEAMCYHFSLLDFL